jgi:predicted anti-sigma-YlaC factor YlaD
MTDIAEMSCQELAELVNAYLEGTLAEGDHARFDAHLATCSGCAIYLDQMRRTIAMTGTLHEDALSHEARDRLLAAFRAWKSGLPPDPQ